MIRVENIGVRREDWVLRDISFDIDSGALVGIIGQSGAGKTTLLKAIAGLLDVVEGQVSLDGKKLIGPSEKLVPGYEEIQLVNQDFGLELFHTVEENIREKILHLPKVDQIELTNELLDLVELKELSGRQARWISGGEQQRLSIARALACEPRFLLLDEPFVHLDQSLRIKIMQYLRDLNEVRNMGIVLVSHDGSDMIGLIDEVVHLADGQVQRKCSVEEMYYYPETIEQGILMGMLNSAEINGEQVLFRPTEYDLGGNELQLEFVRSFNSGTVHFNYFRTPKGEEVVLSALEERPDITQIGIKKKL